MNSAKINDWLQVIGMFGVIASMVFIGMQLKLSQEIALSTAYQARATATMELLMTQASTSEFTSSQAKIYADDVDSLTPEEKITEEYFLMTRLVKYENEFFQYERGFLSEEHWTKDLEELKCELSHPFYRTLLDGWYFRESFEVVLRDVLETAESAPSDCWD